jgi:uncharacterized hydrophobic protein (TIGR00271 family)
VSRHPGRAGVHTAEFSAGGRRASHEAADTGSAPREDVPAADTHGRSLILASVARDARLDRKFILLITLATAVATLGLLQDSAAVVIGAMLVSPLLGPIMGVGFGLATLEPTLIKRSLITLGAGMGAAIGIAMLLVWLSPIADVTGELSARTQPTLLDLGVAVVGGIAGVYAILRKLSGVMVGVAIATALVPPLSTVGFGLVTGRLDMALGAGLLFLTNTLAIAFAATVVARLNRFGPSLTPQHTAMQVVGIVLTLGILSIPLALSLNRIAREVAARSVVQTQLGALIDGGTRIDELSVQLQDEAVTVDGVLLVDRFDATLNTRLRDAVAERLDRTVSVNIVQLRQQTGAAQQVEDRLNQRLAALERRDAESEALLRDLMVGGLIERSAISLDAQTRRAVVARDADGEGDQVAAALDRIMAAAQAAHPGWVIVSGPLVPVTPAPPAPPAETAP